jgi:hypothetical protein
MEYFGGRLPPWSYISQANGVDIQALKVKARSQKGCMSQDEIGSVHRGTGFPKLRDQESHCSSSLTSHFLSFSLILSAYHDS